MLSLLQFDVPELSKFRELRRTKRLPQATRRVHVEVRVILNVLRVPADEEVKLASLGLVDRLSNL